LVAGKEKQCSDWDSIDAFADMSRVWSKKKGESKLNMERALTLSSLWVQTGQHRSSDLNCFHGIKWCHEHI